MSWTPLSTKPCSITWRKVDIIHGIGTGVIREGVTKYLQRNKHVKSFGYAPQNAGGSELQLL